MAFEAQFTNADAASKFMMAGNATITLVSKTTGVRFTYKIRKPQERKGAVSHFVSLLNGADNENDFTYLGQFYNEVPDYKHGQKSPVGQDAPSAKAFAWFTKQLLVHTRIPETLEVWHEGRCGRCGRKLTVPSSIESGFGPECINHV